MRRECRHCHASLAGRRVDARYCSDAHAQAARTRRRKGLAEDIHVGTGRRGRVPLGQPTRLEELTERIREEIATLNLVDELARIRERIGDARLADRIQRGLDEL